MSNAEDEVEGEEGEETKKQAPKELKAPSQIQLKLAEQAKYVAGKFELLFATTLKIQADITTLNGVIQANQESLIKTFNTQMAVLQNRVATIEKERKEEKAAVEAARRAALGLPPQEPNPMASFNQLHLDLGELVKSKPELAPNAVKKLEETLAALEMPPAASGEESPPAAEEPAAPAA